MILLVSSFQDAKLIYQSLFLMSVRVPEFDEYSKFVREVVLRSRTHFNQKFEEDAVNAIIGGFHDSVLLYGKALNETLAAGEDPNDGRSLSRRLWNRTFTSFMSGDINLNENGDRESNFILTDLDPKTLQMNEVRQMF